MSNNLTPQENSIRNLESALVKLEALLKEGTDPNAWQHKTWRKKLVATASQVSTAGQAVHRSCADLPDLAPVALAGQLAAVAGDKMRQAMKCWLVKDANKFKRLWLEALADCAQVADLATGLGNQMLTQTSASPKS